MTHVYVVSVQPEYAMPKVSGEAYTALEKAQAFIERRSDAPRKISDFRYESSRYIYLIHELALR